MLKRLLIANRGEIALRIVRACRELGVETVVVYSDADRNAPHATAADTRVAIGPAPSADSYLSISRIIDAARASGADAIHPGYGFLSESAEFAGACVDAGLVFVGPPPSVIDRMGSKIRARELATSAGVPVVPGMTPVDQSDSGILAALEAVGLPAFVKASAGGGGKGMRRITSGPGADDDIRSARREAAAFSDGTLYVERCIEHPRHVEVQIVADDRGEVIHLFERDCSVQRRHQKVIEESPSPALTPILRSRMADAAVRLARAASYRNAGTVEFLVDDTHGGGDEAPFYFLEMNTRLQVEHPVTEQVTGVDIVRAQILIAAGGAVPWAQAEISQRGHAIEARIYAEDPARGFVPQAGRLLLYREPQHPGVRIDAGVGQGTEVPVHYDPMLSKVIATHETRDLAIRRLRTALRAYPILGVRTNVQFLLRILDDPRFAAAAMDTTFLDLHGGALLDGHAAAIPRSVRAAMSAAESAGAMHSHTDRAPHDPWQQLRNWKL
jgi:acetyl/propionyl-CoA carboxylase alpha subunit